MAALALQGKGLDDQPRQHAGGHRQLCGAVPDHPLAPDTLTPRPFILATGQAHRLGAHLGVHRGVLVVGVEDAGEVQGDEFRRCHDLEREKLLDRVH